MDTLIKTFTDVREQVVPAYNDQLRKADETLLNALLSAKGQEPINLTFLELVELRQLVDSMKSAVYMLDQQLKGTITTLEIYKIMETPAQRGRPKKGAEG